MAKKEAKSGTSDNHSILPDKRPWGKENTFTSIPDALDYISKLSEGHKSVTVYVIADPEEKKRNEI